MELETDIGWKGLDETQVYNEHHLKQYQQNRQHLQQQYGAYEAHMSPNMNPNITLRAIIRNNLFMDNPDNRFGIVLVLIIFILSQIDLVFVDSDKSFSIIE